LRFRAGLRPQFALWLVGIEISQVFLQELGKAVAAGKKKRGSRQLGPAEGGLAYVAMVVGRAGPPTERHKPVAKGSVHSRTHVRASVCQA